MQINKQPKSMAGDFADLLRDKLFNQTTPSGWHRLGHYSYIDIVLHKMIEAGAVPNAESINEIFSSEHRDAVAVAPHLLL